MKAMIFAAAALALTVMATVSAQLVSDFRTINPLVDESAAVNGSWHGELFQGVGGQEIGHVGGATTSGIAYSALFTPIDASGVPASTPLRMIGEDFLGRGIRLTLYDTHGGSAYIDHTFGRSVDIWLFLRSSFTGSLDWSQIDQFSIAGLGGSQQFHAAFASLAIPEPRHWTLAAGVGLIACAVVRRMRWSVAGVR